MFKKPKEDKEPIGRRCTSTDKKSYIEELAGEAAQAAVKGEINEMVYKIPRHICETNTYLCALDKEKIGNALAQKALLGSQLLWVHLFQEVLYYLDSDEPANPPPADVALEIS